MLASSRDTKIENILNPKATAEQIKEQESVIEQINNYYITPDNVLYQLEFDNKTIRGYSGYLGHYLDRVDEYFLEGIISGNTVKWTSSSDKSGIFKVYYTNKGVKDIKGNISL